MIGGFAENNYLQFLKLVYTISFMVLRQQWNARDNKKQELRTKLYN
jgi:hypothetical protein